MTGQIEGPVPSCNFSRSEGGTLAESSSYFPCHLAGTKECPDRELFASPKKRLAEFSQPGEPLEFEFRIDFRYQR